MFDIEQMKESIQIWLLGPCHELDFLAYGYHPVQETAACPTSPNAGRLDWYKNIKLEEYNNMPSTNNQNPSIFLYSIHVPLYISIMHSFP